MNPSDKPTKPSAAPKPAGTTPSNHTHAIYTLQQSKDCWVAHALQYDLVGTHSSKDDAVRQLRTCLVAQIAFGRETGNHNCFFPAPEGYWKPPYFYMPLPSAAEIAECNVRAIRPVAAVSGVEAPPPQDWRKMCIVEIAAENQSVSDYVKHWEGRALEAESRLAALPQETTAKPCVMCMTGESERGEVVREAAWTHIRGEYSWRHPLEADRMMSIACDSPGFIDWSRRGAPISLQHAFSAGVAWQAKLASSAAQPPEEK